MDFGLIYKNAKVVSKIVKVAGVHPNINALLVILILLLMNLNVFGNALQENIVLLMVIANGASLVVIAAMDQLFKTAYLALQTNIYLIMHAIMKIVQELHIWPILKTVYANNASLDVLYAPHLIFVAFASLDITYIRVGAISNVRETQALKLLVSGIYKDHIKEFRGIFALNAKFYTLINAFSVLRTLAFLVRLAFISIGKVKNLIIL